MNPNDYYQLLMNATKGNKSLNYYSDDLLKQKKEEYKSVAKRYDQYRDETGSIHVGDSIYEDNEDGTFTDSSGKKLSISQLNSQLDKFTEAQRIEAEANKKGLLGKAGDILGAVGGTIADGATGTKDFTSATVGGGFRDLVGEVTGQNDTIRKNQQNAIDQNTDMIKLAGKKMNDASLSDEERKRWEKLFQKHSSDDSTYKEAEEYNQGQIDRSTQAIEGAADAYKVAQYIPGFGTGVESIGTLAALKTGDDGAINKALIKLTQDLDWDELSDEEKKAALAQRNIGAALSTLDVLPGLGKAAGAGVKATIKSGLKEGAEATIKSGLKEGFKAASETYGKTILAQNVKDVLGVGAKELAKQSVKSSIGGGIVGTGIGAGLSAAMGGDIGEGATQGAASGIIGGFLGSPLDVSTGKASMKQAAKDAEVAKIQARNENIAKIRKNMEDYYLNKQKAADQFAADSQGAGKAQLPEGERVKMLMATNPRDDVPATTLADGSQIVPGKFQRSNVNRIKEIDNQLQKFNSGKSKLSGEQAKALSDERKAVINEINSAYDTRTNTGATLDEVTSQLDEIGKGFVPDDAKKPVTRIDDAKGIIGRDFFDNDTRTAALEIVQDANQVTEVLDSLMTPQRFSKMADELDAQYNKDIERIEQMPARRQERELAKLEGQYESKLNELEGQVQEAAPAVQEYTNMLAFLKEKEDRLVTYANTYIAENPGKALEVDETRLKGQVDKLIQQQKIAQVTESMSDVNKPLVGSVENGVRPSENTNPRVQEALETSKVANSGSINDRGVGLSYYATAPAKVLERFGDEGKQIGNVLSEATDSANIADQQVATRVLDWNKRAGRKKGMREVAKALDGDTESFSRLNDSQRKVFSEIRDMFKVYADALGLPEGARIKDYLPHIMNGQTMDKVDLAVMRLATGRNLDGTALTAKDITEANAVIKGIDYETLAMIKKNSLFKVGENGFLKKRTGAEDYSLDLAEIINTYTHAAHNTMYHKPAFETVKSLSESLSPKQNEYLATLMGEIQNMHTADIDSMLDISLSKIPMLGENAFSKGSSTTRKLIYDALLGANPGSAIRNLSQGANTYAKLGNRYTAHGIKMAGASFSKSNGLYDELLRNGVLMNKFSDLLHEGTLSSARSGLDRGLWTMFSSVEQFNRATAYFGAKQRYIDKFIKAAEKKGQKIDINNLPDDVLKNAEHAGRQMSKKTQFEFGVMDVPLGQTSDFAKNTIQFQSFNISQVKFIKDMIVGNTDSLFAKQLDGKYKLSGEGAAQLARYVGASAVFISTVGSRIGMSFEDMIPYYGEVKSIFTENESPTDKIPISPITKLLIGDNRGGKGALQLGSEAISAALGNESAQKNIAGDTIEYGKDLASTLLPGGTQARKTIEGLASAEEGVSTNASGKVRFIQDQDFSSRLRAGMFGQYQTNAGQEWVKEGFPTFSEKQSKVIQGQETLNDKERYADMYKITRGKQAARDEIEKVYLSRGSNAAFRKTQEWNDKQDKLIAEYRQKHPGALPKEISDALNKSKIIYKNLRMGDD